MKKPPVSIIVTAYNSAPYIKRCVQALLQQTYSQLELIIVNDGSTDNTLSIIRQFDDPRIRIISNSHNQGIAKSRNVGLAAAQGKYIFFTDSDCLPTTDWLKRGLNKIADHDIVTGWTLYENSSPTLRDRIVQGKNQFFTCNLGFKKKSLETVGKFNEQEFLWYGEDKDLCQRILRAGGSYVFCEEMIVIHQQRFRSIKSELKEYKNYYRAKLHSQIKYGQEKNIHFRIVRPDLLLSTIFPVVILLTKPIRSSKDLAILPFMWWGLVIGRLALWKESFKAGKFYI